MHGPTFYQSYFIAAAEVVDKSGRDMDIAGYTSEN